MTPLDTFLTLDKPGEGLYKEKGSRFIGYAYPVKSEHEIKSLLENLRKIHPKCRHLCYAYRVGPDIEFHRINDDGEPSGTGGMPILNQLKSHQLENALVGVVRYFGGTLLGTSGLTLAYKSAAAEAIKQSGTKEVRRNSYFQLSYEYSLDKKMKAWINLRKGRILSQDFNNLISSKIAVPLSMKTTFNQQLLKQIAEQQWPADIECQWLYSDEF